MKKGLLLSILMAVLSFTAYAQLTSGNAQRYYAEFKKYFNDAICTELATPYSAMTDDELKTAMSAMPTELINVALKIKNNDWGKYEKEFRVAKFKPHTNPMIWEDYMNVYTYSLIPSPTGITGNNEYIMIFVGDDVPEGVELAVNKVDGNNGHAFLYNPLKQGLNMIQMPDHTEAYTLFIEYYVDTDTTATSKKLADYPEITLHFEGGHVNGYFDITKHDDAYWREMIAAQKADSIANSYTAVQVMGERVMFHMTRDQIASVCPNTITDVVNWWDDLVKFEHKLMGADKYYDRWNDLIMARNGVGSYMYATQGFTYYENSTLHEILPWSAVYSSPGRIWGPAHEIGHVNQGAINIVSCTEASNNLFSNAMIHNVGKTTTRGSGVSFCINEFIKKTPFPARKDDPIGVSRMFFQLYLYFHAAGKDTTFYPRLFEALRKDRLSKGWQDNSWVYHTSAIEDQLKFAEKCCEIAQMDLSEFFEVWGFFEPMNETLIGDYSNYSVNLTKEEADASRARMQQYANKGGHLMFIEDRIKPSKRTDGVPGYRIDFNEEYAVGKMGDIGQWEDYIDESVKAQGYYFSVKSNAVEITVEENATGALGFKIYDADNGKLLSFGNTYTITIPTYALNCNLKVVAAQADGTDYEVPSIEMSDNEDMQKKALEAKISSVKTIVLRTTTTGNEIGRYYADAAADLKKVYNEANTALKNSDTSKHSYREWIALLDEELNKLKSNTNARSYLAELDVYNISNSDSKKKGYYMCNSDMGITASNKVSTNSDEACWLVESTGEFHHYYIKNKNGKYINDIEYGTGSMCSGSSKENAVVFKANYLDKGAVYFTTKDGMYLTLNSDNNVVGGSNLIDAAVWYVTRIEKNNTAIEEIGTENSDDTLYDLQGRRIKTPNKGIYIKNGKLYIK